MKSNAKKSFFLITFLILMTFIFCPKVYAINYNNLCSEPEIINIMQIIGYIIQILKIVVPMIIIVLGMVDFGKATISSDDKAISKASSSLIRRIVIGVVIFLIPTIVFALINAVGLGKADDASGSFYKCTMCMLKPNEMCN